MILLVCFHFLGLPQIIIDDKDVRRIELSYIPSQMYYSYVIFKLKDRIIYHFHHNCKLEKSKYNLLVKDLNPDDDYFITSILEKMNIEFNKERFYISPNCPIRFSNEDENYEGNWKVTITIIGYKTDTDGKRSPVWRICHARQTIY